jgi:hypothetical protein
MLTLIAHPEFNANNVGIVSLYKSTNHKLQTMLYALNNQSCENKLSGASVGSMERIRKQV